MVSAMTVKLKSPAAAVLSSRSSEQQQQPQCHIAAVISGGGGERTQQPELLTASLELEEKAEEAKEVEEEDGLAASNIEAFGKLEPIAAVSLPRCENAVATTAVEDVSPAIESCRFPAEASTAATAAAPFSSSSPSSSSYDLMSCIWRPLLTSRLFTQLWPAAAAGSRHHKQALGPSSTGDGADSAAAFEISLESIEVNFKEDYVGGGNQSSVFRGRWQGRWIALKKLNKTTEVDIRRLAALDHPNVIRTLGICTQDIYPCIVMEYCDKGQLFELLRSVAVTKALFLRWTKEVASGMQYLHGLKIVHRDLKSPNILVSSEDALKICDFGSLYAYTDAWEPAAVSSKDMLHQRQQPSNNAGLQQFQHMRSVVMSVCGTSQWMPPEMMKNEPCNEKVDVWSYGVVVWELLTNEVPYRNVSPAAIMFGVGSDKLRLHVPESAPKCVKLLLKQCWTKRPRNRPSFNALLNHLANLRVELDSVSEDAWRMRREAWRKEIYEATERITSMHYSDDRVGRQQLEEAFIQERQQCANDLVEKRMHELRHVQEIRELYDQKIHRVNRLLRQILPLMDKLSRREDDLNARERVEARERRVEDAIRQKELQRRCGENRASPMVTVGQRRKSTNRAAQEPAGRTGKTTTELRGLEPPPELYRTASPLFCSTDSADSDDGDDRERSNSEWKNRKKIRKRPEFFAHNEEKEKDVRVVTDQPVSHQQHGLFFIRNSLARISGLSADSGVGVLPTPSTSDTSRRLCLTAETATAPPSSSPLHHDDGGYDEDNEDDDDVWDDEDDEGDEEEELMIILGRRRVSSSLQQRKPPPLHPLDAGEEEGRGGMIKAGADESPTQTTTFSTTTAIPVSGKKSTKSRIAATTRSSADARISRSRESSSSEVFRPSRNSLTTTPSVCAYAKNMRSISLQSTSKNQDVGGFDAQHNHRNSEASCQTTSPTTANAPCQQHAENAETRCKAPNRLCSKHSLSPCDKKRLSEKARIGGIKKQQKRQHSAADADDDRFTSPLLLDDYESGDEVGDALTQKLQQQISPNGRPQLAHHTFVEPESVLDARQRLVLELERSLELGAVRSDGLSDKETELRAAVRHHSSARFVRGHRRTTSNPLTSSTTTSKTLPLSRDSTVAGFDNSAEHCFRPISKAVTINTTSTDETE